jgi:hypothetical protein
MTLSVFIVQGPENSINCAICVAMRVQIVLGFTGRIFADDHGTEVGLGFISGDDESQAG